MTDETLFLVGDIIMATAVAGVIVFAASYALFFAWRRTAAGKALMYFTGALAMWGIQSFAARMNPEYWGRAYTRIGVYALISVAVWGLVAALWGGWNRPVSIHPRNLKEEEND